MKNFLKIFEPLTVIHRQTVLIMVIIQIIFIFVLWQIFGNALIPGPIQVAKSIIHILASNEFIDNIYESVSLTIKGMFYSILIALVISYLSLIPFFKPLSGFIVKCRYLTLTGLIFLFTLLTKDGHQLKISLLIFGIVPFFVTSLISIIEEINVQEYELCKTLRMNNWEILWEVVIVGQFDKVFEVMRQNFAISWMMITMVEGLNMSEGGLGTMLIKSSKYIDLGTVFGILFIILTIGISFDFLLSKMRFWLFRYAKFKTIEQ